MTKLTESEAREIANNKELAPITWMYAKGFLAGLESERERTKGLVEALFGCRWLLDLILNPEIKEVPHSQVKQFLEEADTALKAYEDSK